MVGLVLETVTGKIRRVQPVYLVPPETIPHELESIFAPLDIGNMFAHQPNAPLEVDLGCGDGSFLAEMAQRMPERNFIGVERLLGRVRRTARRAACLGLRNVRLVRLESGYLVRYLLPRGSVAVMHVMFPDPWPKRRHHHHRLVQPGFLDVVQLALAPKGELRLTTDDLPYYQHMQKVFKAHSGFAEEPWDPGEDYPRTDFEQIFRAKGLPVYRVLLRKTENEKNAL